MTSFEIDEFVFPEFTKWGWFFNDIERWDDQTDNKVGASERPRGHGANRRKRAFRSSLAFTLHVGFIGSDRVDLEEAQLQLTALGAEGPVTVRKHSGAGTFSRQATVEHIGQPSTRGRRRMAGIAIDMIAEDPRKYGLPQFDSAELPTPGTGMVYPITYPLDWGQPGSGGRITLTNAGTAPAAPVFHVAGGLSSVTITEAGSGKRLILSREIPVGSTVKFDGRRRRVTLDGVTDISSNFLTRREWPLIAPGHSSTFLFSGTATGGVPSLTGELQSAWW